MKTNKCAEPCTRTERLVAFLIKYVAELRKTCDKLNQSVHGLNYKPPERHWSIDMTSKQLRLYLKGMKSLENTMALKVGGYDKSLEVEDIMNIHDEYAFLKAEMKSLETIINKMEEVSK